MSQLHHTTGNNRLNTALSVALLAASLCVICGLPSGFAQPGDFIRIEPAIPQNATDAVATSSQIGTRQAVTPSSQNFLVDELYRFETSAIEPLLTPREQQYLDRLIELGLTDLADFYCRKRIASDTVTLAQKYGYTRALLQAKKQDLCNTATQYRPHIWEQIRQLCNEADARFADTPFASAVLLQQINIRLAYAELLTDDANATNTVSSQAAEQFTVLIALIDAELARISQRIASQPASASMSRETSALITLGQLFRLRKAVALRLLAGCEPEPNAELLSQALAILSSVNDPRQGHLATFAAFEAIACYRMMLQYDAALVQAEHLRTSDFLAPHQRMQLFALDLILAVDQRDENRVHSALRIVEAALQQLAADMPELLPDQLLAQLQAYLFFWKRNIETQGSVTQIVGTTTAPNITECRRQVLEITQRLQRDCAPYWSQRAEQMMAAESRFFGNDPVFVELRADALAREGQIDEAVERYDRLAVATTATNPAESFRFAKKAADLLAADVEAKRLALEYRLQTQDGEQAVIDRYRSLAMTHDKYLNSPDAHLAAVYYAARRLQSGDETHLDDYLSLLREHYQTWPHSKQAESLRVQMAKLLVHTSKYREAIDTLAPITNRSPVALDAVNLVDQCFEHMRLEKTDANATVENEAVAWFYRRLLNADGVVVANWNDADAQCVLSMAKYGLHYASVIERNRTANPNVNLMATYETIEKMLRIGLANYQQATPEWRATVDSMMLYVLAAQEKTNDTARILQSMQQWDIPQLMTALDRLQQLADILSSNHTNRQTLGAMRLTIVQIIEQKLPLDAQFNRRRFDVNRADALADTGKTQEAIDLLTQLLRQSPGEVELLVPLAKILERQPDTPSREMSLQIWRKVEQSSPTRSDTWWDAKEAVLRLLIGTGQRDEAEEMFQMLKILNPELGGADRKSRIEPLIRPR